MCMDILRTKFCHAYIHNSLRPVDKVFDLLGVRSPFTNKQQFPGVVPLPGGRSYACGTLMVIINSQPEILLMAVASKNTMIN